MNRHRPASALSDDDQRFQIARQGEAVNESSGKAAEDPAALAQGLGFSRGQETGDPRYDLGNSSPAVNEGSTKVAEDPAGGVWSGHGSARTHGLTADPIRDPMNDPNAPWNYRNRPPAGFVRVHVNAEDFVDLPADDADAMYVDNNIVNFAIQPVPVTLEIDSQPITLYYQNGAELRIPRLSMITDDFDDGTYLTYVAGTQLVRCDRNFRPMYNAFTTPRLHWLKVALHDKVRELAAQQLEMAEIVAKFATIIAQYSSLDGTAAWTGMSSGRFPV